MFKFNPFRSKYKTTDYSGGYLRMDSVKFTSKNTLKESSKFVAPRKIDHRDLCIATDNQQDTPFCVGYSTAGFVEVKQWMARSYPEQEDAVAIYNEAKRIDGDDEDGTSLDSGINAALNLGIIKGKSKYIANDQESIKYAIHTNGVCVGGFLITDEWNTIHRDSGRISDFGPTAAQRGGHAVLLCGYDNTGLYIQNS